MGHYTIVQERFAQPIKRLIEEHPAFGYRTVAHLLGFNKNTVQRIFQLMRWQVRKRPVGFRPRVRAMPSEAAIPNERWTTAWSSPLAATPPWFVVMACARSSSRRTARSRTAWWSG